jgi:hypothetical protein
LLNVVAVDDEGPCNPADLWKNLGQIAQLYLSAYGARQPVASFICRFSVFLAAWTNPSGVDAGGFFSGGGDATSVQPDDLLYQEVVLYNFPEG